MKNSNRCRVYQSVDLFINHEHPDWSHAFVYASVVGTNFTQAYNVDAEQGKAALAKLMLRKYKLPEVKNMDKVTYYTLSGFIDLK